MTSKFNKRALAAAIAAAVLIPSLASAARLDYPVNTQITFAKDLFPRETGSISTPAKLTLIAAPAADASALAEVALDNELRITVTLDNNAAFNSGSLPAKQLAKDILVGSQLGGTGQPLSAVDPNFDAYYSSGDGELIVTFKNPTAGPVLGTQVYGDADYALQFPALQVYNLRHALYLPESETSHELNAEVTVSNVTKNAKVLGARRVIARSQWGENFAFASNLVNGQPSKYIDVADCEVSSDTFARRTRFGSAEPGSACGTSGNTWINLGNITGRITTAALEGGFGTGTSSGTSFVKNTNGVASWSLVSPTTLTYTVKGEALPTRLWLDRSAFCTRSSGAFLPLAVNTARTEATYKYDMANPGNGWAAYFAPLMTPTASGVTLYVCAGANGNEELFPQDVSASVYVDHVLLTQYVNPPLFTGGLAPLRYNAALLTFQNVNPADTPSAQSFLRLTNHNSSACPVTIDAKDDAGRHSGEVKLTIAAHASEQLNVNVLETGVDAKGRTTGKFGDGTGKWFVRVSPDCTNFTASALNRNNEDGTVTDLTPEKGTGLQWRTPSVKILP